MPMATSGRVLVTGAGGFAGRWMARRLAAEGCRVLGTGYGGGADLARLDIRDGGEVRRLVAEFKPDRVVHLAGKTYLPEVLEDQVNSFRVNVLGAWHLLQAVAESVPDARVLLVSSCTVYGDPDPADLPLKESAPLRALHPYGVQKIGLETVGAEFRASHGLDVLVARPFNHVGPGLHPRISLARFALLIAEAEAGSRDPVLPVGNLEARRDFLDVRDVVDAYARILAAASPPRLLNVASGRSVRIGDALEHLVSLARVPLTVARDPARLRPLDTPDLCGDSTKLREALQWSPKIPFEDSLADILDEARRRVAGEAP